MLLIEVGSLLEKLCAEQVEARKIFDDSHYWGGYHSGLTMARTLALKEPVIDLVRCEDCAFCYYNACSGLYHCESFSGLHRIVKPDAFCCCGVRKGGGENAAD